MNNLWRLSFCLAVSGATFLAYAAIFEQLLNNPGIYPSEEVRQNLFVIQDNPDGEQAINDAWNELKIFLG